MCKRKPQSCVGLCMFASAEDAAFGVCLLSWQRFQSLERWSELNCALSRRPGRGPCQPCWFFVVLWREPGHLLCCVLLVPLSGGAFLFLNDNKLYVVRCEGEHLNVKDLFLCTFRVYTVCIFLPVYHAKGCFTRCKAEGAFPEFIIWDLTYGTEWVRANWCENKAGLQIMSQEQFRSGVHLSQKTF